MKAKAVQNLAIALLLSGCASRDVQLHESMSPHGVRAPESADRGPELTLYLHVFSPRYYTEPPKPPERMLTTKVCVNADIFVAIGAQGETFSGTIEADGEKFYARLQTKSSMTLNWFEGEMALDRFEVSQGALSSGGFASVFFVLSRSSDYSAFLRKLEGPFDPELYNQSLSRQQQYRSNDSNKSPSETRKSE